MTKVVAVVQARMASTRLPGKVLLPVTGDPDAIPLLAVLLERLAWCRRLNQIGLAVPDDPYANLFASWLFAHVLNGFVTRGAEDDVLDRYYEATQFLEGSDYVVRITADCPLVCPEEVDRVIWTAQAERLSYCQTGQTYPEGLGVEVFTKAALDLAWAQARGPEREHVTLWMRRHVPQQRTIELPEDCGALRLTVDYPEDYAVVRDVIGSLGPLCRLDELLALWRKEPERFTRNAHIKRDEWKEAAGEPV